MVKNIVFDFGNVIVDFDTYKMTAAYINNEEKIKQLEAVVFDRIYWDRLDAGTITAKEIKNGFRKRLPDGLYETACDIFDHWVENLRLIDGISDVIKNIKQSGKRLFLLSNISEDFKNRYPKNSVVNELLSDFDGIVLSGVIKKTKPNREIFVYLLEKFSLNASECLFIDDNIKNVSGAKECGFNTYLFDGNVRKLDEYVKSL